MQKFVVFTGFFLIILSSHIFSQEYFNYTSLRDDAKYVNVKSSILLGCDEKIDQSTSPKFSFGIKVTKSGNHPCRLKLSDNEKILILTPGKPFSTKEKISVTSSGIVKTILGKDIAPISLEFETSSLAKPIHHNYSIQAESLGGKKITVREK